MPINDVFQPVSVERFMEYGEQIRANLARLSQITDQQAFNRALKKITNVTGNAKLCQPCGRPTGVGINRHRR